MPTYLYSCNNCHYEFDVNASLEEKEKNSGDKFICPDCNSKDVVQKITAANIGGSSASCGGCCSGCHG